MTAQPQIVRTNRTRQLPLLPGGRENQTLEESIIESLDGLRTLGAKYKHWAIGFSGGKDSTATAALVAYLISKELVEKPKSILVLRSDTLMELPTLDRNAENFMQALRENGIDAQTVKPDLDSQFYVQILGKGLMPPSNNVRWCTRTLKVDPMKRVVEKFYAEHGEKFLMITGVRDGESVARDARLEVSRNSADEKINAPICSKDAGECGTGMWLDKRNSQAYDMLPLIVHWRTCHVYDFLQGWFVSGDVTGNYDDKGHGFELYTKPVAKMYGQFDDGTLEEDGSRYGCIKCQLVQKDKMLAREIKRPGQENLKHFDELDEVLRAMREPQYRLRKDGTHRLKDGSAPKNPMRMGPLTLEARLMFLDRILEIQIKAGIELISKEAEARIREMIANNTWPRDWDGTEPRATDLITFTWDNVHQPRLIENL